MKLKDLFDQPLESLTQTLWWVAKEARSPIDAVALRRAAMYIQKWEHGIPQADEKIAKEIQYRVRRIISKVMNEREALEEELRNQHRR
jgi:uncharacterized protein YmfQ (DUF2313 family)